MTTPARRALIFGISGQDGAYLAQLLLARGYEVHGTSRDRELGRFANLDALGIRERVTLHSAAMDDFRSVVQVIKEVGPDEIYNLAGQSSVALSFSQPVETLDSIVHGTINILESMRFLRSDARFYNAASGECFGNTTAPSDENTPFRPRSPYGVAKAAAFWAVANYRESYDLFACSGILFNHESPLRPDRFVTRKIIRGAAEIVSGRATTLELGTLDIRRDWGWAPEYVEAMWRMMQRDAPDDFVIATGETHSLEEFVAYAFSRLDLDWRKCVRFDPQLRRPDDIVQSMANPAKAAAVLKWQAQNRMHTVVEKLIAAEMERIQNRG